MKELAAKKECAFGAVMVLSTVCTVEFLVIFDLVISESQTNG